ncbi:hypothetical protein R1flu_023057 [Riccia fluitans]|uniref:Reverse transcriptase domain-containing protein n=1 Tax=Riccia fluitans TaxID=41844 RepID=A0ABD1XRF7_9MARC
MEVSLNQNTETIRRLKELEELVRTTEKLECNILRRRSRAEWTEKEETCSKYFFATLKSKQAQERLMHLVEEGGREITKEGAIMERVHSYYTDLYKQPLISQDDRREQEETLMLVDQLVSEEENLKLTATPDEGELEETMKLLPKGKAPREDGLPIEVLRELWTEISSHCLQFLREAWQQQRIGKSNTRAIVKLIPKSDKKEEVRNWRPISLLNLSYKLIGRVLAKRLKSTLSKLVDEEHTGFIQGRSIADNIVSLGLCQELANAQGRPVIFCKLDFVKAFNRVQHEFLWATMKQTGTNNLKCSAGPFYGAQIRIEALKHLWKEDWPYQEARPLDKSGNSCDGELVAKMRVSNAPYCRCNEAEETTSRLFFDCRNSQTRWRQLHHRSRSVQTSFRVTHSLLGTIDEALNTKEKGSPLIFIIFSITNAIWRDRNTLLFRGKNQNMPLSVCLESARQEVEGSFNKQSSAINWQRGIKALEELKELLGTSTQLEPPLDWNEQGVEGIDLNERRMENDPNDIT